jgi:restriction endonuclease Mrr
MQHARRKFERRRDGEAMRDFLEAIEVYKATAHFYCVTSLKQPAADAPPSIPENRYVN